MAHTSELADLLEKLRQGDPDARCRVVECRRGSAEEVDPQDAPWLPEGSPLGRNRRVSRTLFFASTVHWPTCGLKGYAEFYALAGMQIRRELLDLAKHFQGAQGIGAKHHSDRGRAAERKCADPLEPETLEAWARFHEAVGCLPDEEREVVQLVWYDGMKRPEAAAVLGVSLATLKRRWQSARLHLSELLEDWSLE